MASPHRDEISRLELLHAAHPDGLVFPHLADAYRRAGRYAQAETVLNAGLRRHAEYSSAHVVLGRLRLDQGKRAEAVHAFERVLQLDPQNQVALEYLADLAHEEGRADQALAYYRKLSRIKHDGELADRVEELERRVAERDAASPRAREPVSRGDAGSDRATAAAPAARTVANGYSNGGGESRAGRDLDLPAPRPPGPAEVVTETMAELYARQGLDERAASVYQQLLSRHPGDSRLSAKLAEVRSRMRGGAAPARAAEPPSRTAQGPRPAATAAASIRDELRGLLSWRPGPAADSASPAAAPPQPEAPPAPSPAPSSRQEQTAEPEPEVFEPWMRTPRSKPEPEVEWEREQTPRPKAESRPERLTTERSLKSAAAPAAEPASTARARVAPVGAEMEMAAGMSEQARSLIALTDMLVGLLEYRDPFFRGSSSLTRLLATSVGEELALSPVEQVDLALAAVLRDLGRLAMGGRLVPNVRMGGSEEGRQRIERHVDLALHLMEGIELPRSVRLAVRHHHERWDGAGYPDGVCGEEIPRLARILAVVDAFAAMVSPRPYRLPRKVPEAAREMESASGTQFDPQVVEALLRVLARREQANFGFVQRHHILIVNPDQPGAVVTAAKLCSAGYLAEVAVDVQTARERLRRVPVAALVVSAEAGGDAAGSFVREIRQDPMFTALPVVVTDAATVGLRVRLLEDGADVCFPPGVSHAELHGTLGAMVRRNLRSRARQEADGSPDAPWLALQGDIEDFPLTWLLQVMKYDTRTAAIMIRGRDGRGVIYLKQGDAVHAQVGGGIRGESALREMLGWEKGRFTLQPDAQPSEQTIQSSIMHLLLSQAVEEDHAAAGIFGAVSDEG